LYNLNHILLGDFKIKYIMAVMIEHVV